MFSITVLAVVGVLVCSSPCLLIVAWVIQDELALRANREDDAVKQD